MDKNLGIGDKLVIEPIKVKNKAIGTSFFLKEGKNEYQLKDNGFGINKILQILLEIASFEAIDYNKLNFKHQLSYDSLNERVDLKKILLLEGQNQICIRHIKVNLQKFLRKL